MDLKSNEPFWLIKNGLLSSYPSLRTDESCDVLVVGSGITGSLLAHQMVKDGYKTILIDQREVCNGSTSATTSMLQYEIDVPLCRLSEIIGKEDAVAAYKACAQSIADLHAVSREIGSRAGFKKKKSLYFASRKKDVAWLKEEFEARKEAGFRVKWLETAEIHEKYGIQKAYGGILSRTGASVDAFRLAHELLKYNAEKGLQIYDKTRLETVKYSKNHVTAEMNSGFTIKTKKIIYCVGYESQQMIPEKFVQLKSTFAVVSEIQQDIAPEFQRTLFWNTDEPYLYMRTTSDGRLLAGGCDVDFQNPQKRDESIARKEQQIMKHLSVLMPDQPFYPDFSWAGTFGETKDGLPYIGEHSEFPHSYFVLGFGGNGITFSVTGMAMASAFMKKKSHPLAHCFRFGR